MNFLPLLTSVFAAAFTFSLGKQYLDRKKIHQLLWTGAMLFYSVSALMEFLMNRELMGPSVIAFKIYYVLAAPLVGLLGAGVLYLLAGKKVGDIFTGFIALLSGALFFKGMMEPLDQAVLVEAFEGPLGVAFHDAVHAYPMSVRVFAIIINIIGGLILILGALYSYAKDRRRSYNLLFFFGGLMPMIGGSALAFFNEPNFFFIFELFGTVFLYAGFILSYRFIQEREARISARS
jgi:hypothetical protein